MMKNLVRLRAFLAVVCLLAGGVAAQAQGADKPAEATPPKTVANAPDLDFQVYLLTGTETAVEGGKIPATLEPTVKQLKASLPFTHFRLSDTMLQRTRGFRGRIELKWALRETATPTFFELSGAPIFYETDDAGREFINVETFRFGGRVPVVVGSNAHAPNAPAAPVVNYEPVGLTTSFRVREGEPSVIGTVSNGKEGEIGVVVVLVRKSPAK
jgi:hypothetical protein